MLPEKRYIKLFAMPKECKIEGIRKEKWLFLNQEYTAFFGVSVKYNAFYICL